MSALVRAPERLKESADRIAVMQGDMLNSSEIEGALDGQDAVLSSFGPREPRSKADVDLLRRFAVALTSAMLSIKIQRVVVVSVAFLLKDSIPPPTYLFGRLFFRDTVIDASGMEDVFRTWNDMMRRLAIRMVKMSLSLVGAARSRWLGRSDFERQRSAGGIAHAAIASRRSPTVRADR